MELIQEVILIRTGSSGGFLVKKHLTPEGKVVRYEYCDQTPILPNSKHYKEYMKATSANNLVSSIIAKEVSEALYKLEPKRPGI